MYTYGNCSISLTSAAQVSMLCGFLNLVWAHLVGHLGWGMISLQNISLHRVKQTEKFSDIYLFPVSWTHNSSVWAIEDSMCQWLCGHCDVHHCAEEMSLLCNLFGIKLNKSVTVYSGRSYSWLWALQVLIYIRIQEILLNKYLYPGVPKTQVTACSGNWILHCGT
jgi:hypothetical protein